MSNGKEIIIFAFGLVAGGVTGYFLGKQHESEKADEQIRNAQEHYKKRYEARLNDDLKDKLWSPAENATEKEEKEPKKVERTAKIPNVEPKYDEILQKTNYNAFSKSNVEEENGDVVPTDSPYEVQPGYYDDFIGIDRHDLTYFAEDGVVMDSKETVWNDAIDRIGAEHLDPEKFGRYEPDIIYVINEDFGEGYKITLDEGSYDDYMAGVEGL